MKNTNIIISFCNQIESKVNNNLAILHLNSLSVRYLPIDIDNNGFTGLCQNTKFIFGIYQGTSTGIVVLDKVNFDLIYSSPIANVFDPHSLACDLENNLYIVSTGKDQILQFYFDEHKLKLVFIKCVFSLDQTAHYSCDSHHMNSILFNNGSLIISAFGPKYGVRWSTAQRGYVYDLSKNRILFTNIYHPHSILLFNNDIYFCESSTSSVFKNNKSLLNLQRGYTRGLSILDRYLIVGISCGRLISKSLQIINNPADPGIPSNDCGIVLFKSNLLHNKYNLINEINLFPDKSEIYDILCIN